MVGLAVQKSTVWLEKFSNNFKIMYLNNIFWPSGVRVAARDLKSLGPKGPCGFESHLGHAEEEYLRKQTATYLSLKLLI